jgi:hypothetical protein
MTEEHWRPLLDLDRLACGAKRAALLHNLAAGGGMLARTGSSNGHLGGYGVLRPGRRAWHLGPLVADDPETAAELVDALVEPSDADVAQDVIVDVVDGSAFEAVLARRGFAIARRLQRMVRPRGDTTLLAGERVYAVTGFELG